MRSFFTDQPENFRRHDEKPNNSYANSPTKATRISNLKLPDESQLHKAKVVEIRKPLNLLPTDKPYVHFILVLEDPQYDSPYHLPDGTPFWFARYYLPADPGDPNDKHVRFFKSLVFQTYRLPEYPQSYSHAKNIFKQNKWLWLAFTFREREDKDSGERYFHPYAQLTFPTEEHHIYLNDF